MQPCHNKEKKLRKELDDIFTTKGMFGRAFIEGCYALGLTFLHMCLLGFLLTGLYVLSQVCMLPSFVRFIIPVLYCEQTIVINHRPTKVQLQLQHLRLNSVTKNTIPMCLYPLLHLPCSPKSKPFLSSSCTLVFEYFLQFWSPMVCAFVSCQTSSLHLPLNIKVTLLGTNMRMMLYYVCDYTLTSCLEMYESFYV